MVYQVVILARARQDLVEICQYVGGDDPRFGLSYCERLASRTDALAEFPEMGSVVREKSGAGYRQLVFSPYRIIYSVNHALRRVAVHTFWHAARGTPRLPRVE